MQQPFPTKSSSPKLPSISPTRSASNEDDEQQRQRLQQRSAILKRAIHEYSPRSSNSNQRAVFSSSPREDISDVIGVTPQSGDTRFTRIFRRDESSPTASSSSSSLLRHSTGRGAYLPMHPEGNDPFQLYYQHQLHPGSYEEILQLQREQNRLTSGRCNLTLNFESRRRQETMHKQAIKKLGVLRNELLIKQAQEEMKKFPMLLSQQRQQTITGLTKNSRSVDDEAGAETKKDDDEKIHKPPRVGSAGSSSGTHDNDHRQHHTGPKDPSLENFFEESLNSDKEGKVDQEQSITGTENTNNNNSQMKSVLDHHQTDQQITNEQHAKHEINAVIISSSTKIKNRPQHQFRPPSSRQLIDLSRPPPTTTKTTKTATTRTVQEEHLRKAHDDKALRVATHQMEALRSWVTRSASRTKHIKDGLSRLHGSHTHINKNGMVEEPAIVSIVEFERKEETPRRLMKLAEQRKKPLNIVEGNGDEVDDVIGQMLHNEALSRKDRDRRLKEERERRADEAIKKRLAMQKAKMEAEREEEERLNGAGF